MRKMGREHKSFREHQEAIRRTEMRGRSSLKPPFLCPKCNYKSLYLTRIKESGITIGKCAKCSFEVRVKTKIDYIDDYNEILDRCMEG